AGLTVDPATGLVSWTPAAAQVGLQDVTLRVTDGNGGAAGQGYQVGVGQDPANTPPGFVTDPPTPFNPPGGSNPASGSVDPTQIDLNLGRGDVTTRDVSFTVPTTGAVTKVDVFLLFDDTGSFSGTAPILIGQFPTIISQLRAVLPDLNLAFGV